MQKTKIVLIFVVLLAVNNFVLLSLLGYFEEASQVSDAKIEPAKAAFQMQADERSMPENSSSSIEDQASLVSNISDAEPQLAKAIKSFVASKEFVEVMDEYSFNSAPRFMRLQRKLSKMQAFELYNVATESENQLEKRIALQTLSQGKMGQLEPAELRTLYLDLEDSNWSRTKVLEALLEKDDPDGLIWAKRELGEESLRLYAGNEIYMGVYDKDPAFFKNYIKQLDIEEEADLSAMVSFIGQEPELSKLYYEVNLDKILASDNSGLYLNWSRNIDIELTKSQQLSLAELFESSNRRKRDFALSFLNNMDDIDILRDAFSRLAKPRERQTFVSSLFYNKDNPKQRELARELASNSDDPKIQKLIKDK